MLAQALANAVKGKGKGKGKGGIAIEQNHALATPASMSGRIMKMSAFTDEYNIVLYHFEQTFMTEMISKINSGELVFPDKYLMIFIKDGRFYGMAKMSGRLELFVLVNDLTEMHYRTSANTAEIEELVATNCKKLSSNGDRMEINFQSTLKASVTKAYASNVSIVTLSNKSLGQYFDLVGLIVVNGELKGSIHYNHRSNMSATHSGDYIVNGYLEHIMRMDRSASYQDTKLVIVVCGYSHTPLHEFERQQPTILLATEYVRGQKITCDLLPIELTIRNLGHSCAAGIAVFDYSTNSVTVLDKPVLVERANTTDFRHGNAMSISFVSSVMAKYNGMDRTPMSTVDEVSNGAMNFVQFETALYKNVDVSSNGVFVLKQEDTSLWMELSNVKTFSDCFGDCHATRKYPIATGCVSGASALFATPQGYIEFGKLNIVMVSGFSQDLMSNPKFLINGIFIIDTGDKDWDMALANLDLTGLCMCGGMSMILIKNNDRLYFFRGCVWNGIMDELPEIFSDVTDMISQLIVVFSTTDVVLPFPVFIHRDSSAKYCICGESRLFTLSELVSITDATQPYVLEQYNSGARTFDDCLNLLMSIAIQTTLMVSDEKVMGDTAGMLDHGHFVLVEQNKLYAHGDEIETLTAQVQQIANDETLTNEMRKKSMKKILDKIRMLKTGKSLLSRKLDLFLSENMYRICGQASYANAKSSKQRIRKALIGEAFDKNKNTTISTYLEDNENRVTDLVLMMCHPEMVGTIVHAIGNGNDYESIIDGFELSDRLPIADNLTVSCLYETSSLSMRDVGFQVSAYDESVALPLPILAENLTNNFTIAWTDMVKEDVPMFFNQKFRHAVSEYGSQNGITIDSSSIELAHMFMSLCIRSMSVISEKMSSVPSSSDAPTTLVLAMRSMMYHVFLTCASTTATISPLYKLAYRCTSDDECPASPKDKHYWVLNAIAKYFKYCALPVAHDIIKDNFVRIIVKMISRTFLIDEFIRKDNERKARQSQARQPQVRANYDPVQNWKDAEDVIYSEFSNPVHSIFAPFFQSAEMAHTIRHMYNAGMKRSDETTETSSTTDVQDAQPTTEIVVVEQLDPIMNMIRDDMNLREILTEFRDISTMHKLPSVVMTMMEDLGFVGIQSMHAMLVRVFEAMILETNDTQARSVGYVKFCELMH